MAIHKPRGAREMWLCPPLWTESMCETFGRVMKGVCPPGESITITLVQNYQKVFIAGMEYQWDKQMGAQEA